MDYEQEYQIFLSNINLAARSFYYHVELNRQIYRDGKRYKYFQYSKIYQAVYANAQFWNDYKYSSVLTCIISLGRILDKPTNTHKVERLIEAAKKSGLFTNKKLRERKTKEIPNDPALVDSFMRTTHEFSSQDFKTLEDFIAQTRKKWEEIKDLRNKIHAHQEVMNDDLRKKILQGATYRKIEEIIKRLLIVDRLLWEAFHNGRKPNFRRQQNKRVHNEVKRDVQSLLDKLSASIV